MIKLFVCVNLNETAYSSVERMFFRKSKPKCYLSETETRYRLMMVYMNAFHANSTSIAAGAAQIAQCHSVDCSNEIHGMNDEIA